MLMEFKGWNHDRYRHKHDVEPIVVRKKFRDCLGAGNPVRWSTSHHASGKVVAVDLRGDFQVDFTFTLEELRNWLSRYVQNEPEAAIRLLSEMQAEALIALARQLADQDSDAAS